jgi:hypothetical protein
MFDPLLVLRYWRRGIAAWSMIAHSDCCRSESIELWYPKIAWYQENAAAMLGIVDETAVDLERKLGLALPKATRCFVVEPERGTDLLGGAMGIACADLAFVAPPERHLSDLGRVAAHELAHVLAHGLGDHQPPFLAEGFACYAAWLIEADRMPMGMPLHYHLVWLLSVGVKPRLEELWGRKDYSPELYDLAWSLAVFVANRFGRDRYFDFYRTNAESPRDRVEATLGVSLARLEKDWYEDARRRVRVEPSQISQLHREAGVLCSRAAWLRKRVPVPHQQ